jgi:hypothetical protein
MNFHFVNAFPMPEDSSGRLGRRCIEIAGTLSAVDERYGAWARAVGVDVGRVPESQRDEMVAELDAVVAHLYGLEETHVNHVFESFHPGWDYSSRLDRVLDHFERWRKADA